MRKMKNKTKKIKRIICLICLITLLINTLQLSNVMRVKADDEYTAEQLREMFPDEKLLAAIYNKLQIGNGASIPVSKLEGIRELIISGKNNNKELYETLDLAGISNLKNLYRLNINYYNIDSETLKNLNDLNISLLYLNQLTGFENFDDMDENLQLIELWVLNCEDFTSLSSLNKFPNLKNLRIYKCPDVTNLSGIENCLNLEELSVTTCNNLTDISVCENLTKLKRVDFGADIALEDISALSELENLEKVDISKCHLSDISALKNKESIKILYLESINIFNEEDRRTSLEVLKTLNHLEELRVSHTEADDEVMEKLCDLDTLVALSIVNNHITDLSKIGNLKNLEKLDMKGNQIVDFSPLASHPKLRSNHVNLTDKDSQSAKITGEVLQYTLHNPVIGMDGKAVAPDTSEIYTYDAVSNTVTINEEYRNAVEYAEGIWDIEYTVPMNYNGFLFDVKVYLQYGIDGYEPITISKEPKDVECIEGEKAEFEVVAESGDSDFSYQWYKDGNKIAGDTSAKIVIDSTVPEDAGSYSCVISNATASAVSNQAVLKVKTKKTITIIRQPEAVECTEGEKAELEIKAESEDSNFTYQWYKDGEEVVGETGAKIVIDTTELKDAGNYSCVIKNETSSITSNLAALTVNKKEEPTTEESTTEETTTEEPTTEEPTTEETTTEEPTKEESTTEETTTKEPTKEESTKEETSTKETATEETTKEEPTTLEPITENRVTEKTVTIEQKTGYVTNQLNTNSAETTSGDIKESVPKTGDNDNAAVMMISVISALAAVVFGRKKMKE